MSNKDEQWFAHHNITKPTIGMKLTMMQRRRLKASVKVNCAQIVIAGTKSRNKKPEPKALEIKSLGH